MKTTAEPKVSLEDNGNILSGKQAANKFADCYAAESNISVGPIKQREARREQKERPKKTTVEPMRQSHYLFSSVRVVIFGDALKIYKYQNEA